MRIIPEHITVDITPDGRLRAGDAAAYLGIKPRTLAAWRAKGRGPRFRKFQQQLVFYHKDDLDQWIASQTLAQSTAELRPGSVDGAVRAEAQRAVGD